MEARRTVLVLSILGSSLFLTAPNASAQYCADDDYSVSCRAQRECEKTRENLSIIRGVDLVSCTQ